MPLVDGQTPPDEDAPAPEEEAQDDVEEDPVYQLLCSCTPQDNLNTNNLNNFFITVNANTTMEAVGVHVNAEVNVITRNNDNINLLMAMKICFIPF